MLPWEPETIPSDEQIAQGLEYTANALALSPDHSQVNGLRGVVLYVAGRHAEAIPFLKIGYESAENDEVRGRAVYAAVEAICQFQIGHIEEANARLQIARNDRFASYTADCKRFIQKATKLIQPNSTGDGEEGTDQED